MVVVRMAPVGLDRVFSRETLQMQAFVFLGLTSKVDAVRRVSVLKAFRHRALLIPFGMS
ncbi:MAG TPA: hypothetical protein VK126_05655 [Nitrososphaerales archaeon]|nr:hypothetical protein [Nitrososphaerales archaeon]